MNAYFPRSKGAFMLVMLTPLDVNASKFTWLLNQVGVSPLLFLRHFALISFLSLAGFDRFGWLG